MMNNTLMNMIQLPQTILSALKKLVVNRIGATPDAFMVTKDIVGHFSPNTRYQVIQNEAINESNIKIVPLTHPKPPHALVRGLWETQESSSPDGANILGGMGALHLNKEELQTIPIIGATTETLAFYQARLIRPGDELQFETNQELPLFEMDIGKDYVEGYLAQVDHGGGEYIEFHDQPHLWIPKTKQSTGHILLGREEEGHFIFTGFTIPYGYGVYLSPNTLHSDAYLQGKYLVVYSITENYSTVLFKDQRNRPLSLQFKLFEEV